MLYDEQPVTFRQSWHQRLRWAKGYLQVFRRYGTELVRGMLHGSFSCFDMGMCIMPAAVLSIGGLLLNLAALGLSVLRGQPAGVALLSAAELLLNSCATLFVIGLITTATEWKHIYAPAWKKVLYAFTFPLFMLTYIPISLTALFQRRVGWKPIVHQRAIALDQIRAGADRSA